MAHFIETTDGWAETAIVQDRAAPRYPRSTALSRDEQRKIDAALEPVARLQPQV